MALAAHHVKAESVLRTSHDRPSGKSKSHGANPIETSYAARYETESIPRNHLPSKGSSAQAAYQIVHDHLELDGTPNLNLASFVHTWMPAEATKLMVENMSKNLIDQDEYPATQEIHQKCISMLAHLWHSPDSNTVGTATTGSSEAIMLGGLAMKRNWEAKRKAAGKDIHNPGPNIIMGANAQVALEKFARYFSVEARLVPVSEESKYCLDIHKAVEMCDENTIGVFVILGSTYTGHYEDVEGMAKLLDEYQSKTGNDIPIHVDGASGGFFAPFANPQLKWDFKIPRVVSINSSGHKFGLAYVGVGWVVFRDKKHLPKELVFELHYLGSVEYSFSLNFSRPAAPIIAQYFSFLHLGFDGYRRVALGDAKNARLLARALEATKYYKVVSDIHRPVKGGDSDETSIEHYTPALPVVAFQFSDEFKKSYPNIQQKFIQHLLRQKSWITPNYELPPSLEKTEILRVVVRESMSEDLVERFVGDIIEVTESLTKEGSPAHALATLSSEKSEKPKREDRPSKMDDTNSTKPATYARPC